MDERLLDKSREIDKLHVIAEEKGPQSSRVENGTSTRAMERSREIERPKDKHHSRRDDLKGSKSDKPTRRRKTKRASKRSISSESSDTHSTSESIGSSAGSLRHDGDRD
jgi:hypothetical protein